MALPLAPALRELFSKRDANPLVTRKDDGKIDNFAKSLRAHCEAFLSGSDQEAGSHRNELVQIGNESVLVVAETGCWSGAGQIAVPVVCANEIELPDEFHGLKDFYCRSDLHSGRNNLFRALLSDRSIELREGTQVLRWIHAESELVAGRNCILFGRASAGRSLRLSPGCHFERMRAPVIYSSADAARMPLRTESAPFSKLAQTGMGRTRVNGRVHVSAREEHYGDLVSNKTLQLDEQAAVYGSVKANGNIELRPRAEVDGSVVSTKRIHIGSGCFIKGPMIAEQEVFIDSGVQIGLPASPTTVSAPRIHLAPGVVLHGTLWARVEGRVDD